MSLATSIDIPRTKVYLPMCMLTWASLIAPLVKNPPTMQETLVLFLGWEDPPEKGMAAHSRILAWTIAWTLQSMEVTELDTNERLSLSLLPDWLLGTEPLRVGPM